MFKKFINRQHRYSIKHLANGAARVYIQNSEKLRSAGFTANSSITITNKKNTIEITLDKDGKNKVMDTGRGELVELKNKATAQSLGDAILASVTFRVGLIIISVHKSIEAIVSRNSLLIKRLIQNKELRTSCFFSGLGMLSYHVKSGLNKAGVRTSIAFANDNNELAMSCNLSGNPMWESATDDASVVVDDLSSLFHVDIPQSDIATVGYPCVAFSLLAAKENLDLNHPQCGTLFIPLIAALKKSNPAVIIFENTPRFGDSETLNLIKRSFPDYNFSQRVFNGHDFNELESRKRVCIVATSKGLPEFDLSTVESKFSHLPQRKVSDILSSDILEDSPLYRVMEHVKKRDTMTNIGYKNHLYTGDETAMVTLPASYSSPKAGTPMIMHPIDPSLQRQVQPDEHANLRELPQSLFNAVMDVWKGSNPLVRRSGSFSAAHRLLGNGVSKRVWQSIGEHLGWYFNQLKNSDTQAVNS